MGIKFFDGSEGYDDSIFVRPYHGRCVLANAKVIVKCDYDIGTFLHRLTFPSGPQRQSQLCIIGMFLVKNFLFNIDINDICEEIVVDRETYCTPIAVDSLCSFCAM
jgi:hypothetical protein